jgi:octaprenyl-diphosphate synthase
MRILADATNRIAEGEVLQLLNVRDPSVTEQRYMQVVERKTATLFEAAARIGAVLAGVDEKRKSAVPSTARVSARLFRSSMTCSTTPVTWKNSANSSAMICARARPRFR